jgi:hypothetical protein
MDIRNTKIALILKLFFLFRLISRSRCEVNRRDALRPKLCVDHVICSISGHATNVPYTPPGCVLHCNSVYCCSIIIFKTVRSFLFIFRLELSTQNGLVVGKSSLSVSVFISQTAQNTLMKFDIA